MANPQRRIKKIHHLNPLYIQSPAPRDSHIPTADIATQNDIVTQVTVDIVDIATTNLATVVRVPRNRRATTLDAEVFTMKMTLKTRFEKQNGSESNNVGSSLYDMKICIGNGIISPADTLNKQMR